MAEWFLLNPKLQVEQAIRLSNKSTESAKSHMSFRQNVSFTRHTLGLEMHPLRSVYSTLPRMLYHVQRGLMPDHDDPASNPHDPQLYDVPRNRHVFPPGFGTQDQSTNDPIEFTLPHLEDILIQQHTPNDHVEHIYVKSAEYCKEREKPQHEFILITVETREDPRFRNYLILDRTSSLPADKIAQHLVQTISPSISSAQARDRLRISYDGTLKPLLERCSLSKYRVLETLEFQKMSFLLYELVALSRAASDRHRTYNTLSNQCYWYASLIWDCTRQLLPAAALTHTLHTEKHVRGKFGKVFHQRIDPKELSTISDGVGQELNFLRRKFADVQKNRHDRELALAQEQEKNAQLRRELEELRSRSLNHGSGKQE